MTRSPFRSSFAILLLAAGFGALGLAVALLWELPLFLPLLLVLAGIVLALSFGSPFMLLIFLLIVRMSLDYSAQYFSFTVYDTTFSLSQIMGVGIALLGLIVFIREKHQLARFPLNAPFWLIFGWGILTLFVSIRPADTLQELLRFFDLYVLGFLAYASVQNSQDFKNLLRAIFISGIPPAAFALYQFVFGIGLTDENVGIPRIFGTFSHPNVLSLYLMALIALAILFFLVYARTKASRWLTLAAGGIFAVILFLTFARVAWVSLFFFLFLLCLYRYRVLLIPLILFPIVLFVFSSAFQARISESLHADPDSSILWRQTMWQDVVSKTVLDDRQYLGSGMNTATLVSESIRGQALGPNETHNDFIKFFVEGGYPGLAVFLTYLGTIFTLLIREYQKNKDRPDLRLAFAVMTFFFLSLILASLTDNVFKNTPVQWIFFIALGGLLALSRKRRN